jgi:hypothetical protein
VGGFLMINALLIFLDLASAFKRRSEYVILAKVSWTSMMILRHRETVNPLIESVLISS